MLRVKIVKTQKVHECAACGKEIPQGTKAVSCNGINEDGFVENERFHPTKKCCEEFFEDWKSITEQAQDMVDVIG